VVAIALHLFAMLIVVPYLLLAIAFLIVGHAMGSVPRGGLLDAVVLQAGWIMPWGALGFIAAMVAVLVLGVREPTRHWGSACVAALGVMSILALAFPDSGVISVVEWLVLSPCIAASALATRQAFRWKRATPP
jgi:hypothetical protein